MLILIVHTRITRLNCIFVIFFYSLRLTIEIVLLFPGMHSSSAMSKLPHEKVNLR